MSDDTDRLLLAIVKLLGYLLMMPAMMALDAFVTKTLWSWFIVPQFALAPLPWVSALGVALVFRHLAPTHWPPKDQRPSFGEHVARGLVPPVVFLVLGWLVHAIFGAAS